MSKDEIGMYGHGTTVPGEPQLAGKLAPGIGVALPGAMQASYAEAPPPIRKEDMFKKIIYAEVCDGIERAFNQWPTSPAQPLKEIQDRWDVLDKWLANEADYATKSVKSWEANPGWGDPTARTHWFSYYRLRRDLFIEVRDFITRLRAILP